MTDLHAVPIELAVELAVLPDADYEPTPLDVWLARQQDLSAVERFAARHVRSDAGAVPASARWRDRLPASPPGPGQQYAFDVDLDACTGCKACVAACHSLNGLEEGEAWRRVGVLQAVAAGSATADTTVRDRQGSVTVTSACHHCVDPACLNGCPAKAYEKDPVTGIVRHLDDACIGCSYCTLTCPYEVPTFQPSLGIVRKCDLCSDRLAVGEAPACVQACPQGAITIAVVSTAELLAEARSAPDTTVPAALVPSAPGSALTVPSTRYRSAEAVPDTWVATDRSSVHPAHGHAPLAVMLVLTQAAVGMTVAAALVGATHLLRPAAVTALAVAGVVTGLVALGASTLHLGRPLLAWRAVLGLRRSWLSREVVAFGLFAGAGIGRAGLEVLGAPRLLVAAASAATLAGGVGGVACSAQLYAVTGRRWWRLPTSAARFAGTAVAGGAIGTAVVVALADPGSSAPLLATLGLAAAAGVTLSVVAPLAPLAANARRTTPRPDLSGTSRLLTHDLRNRHLVRLAAAVVALLLVATAIWSADGGHGASREPGVVLGVAWVVAMLGELQDRRLFFLASVAPRMPGTPR